MPEGSLPIKSRTSGSQTIQQDLKGTTMELGKINTVKIARITPHGAYVTDAEPENTPEAPATATPETKEEESTRRFNLVDDGNLASSRQLKCHLGLVLGRAW